MGSKFCNDAGGLEVKTTANRPPSSQSVQPTFCIDAAVPLIRPASPGCTTSKKYILLLCLG